MKNWFLLLVFAFLSMFAVACLSSSDDGTDDGTDDQGVETSQTTSEVTNYCAQKCQIQFGSCVTGDPLDDCLCKNSYNSCRKSCGLIAPPLTACW
jgi:hypothetical protein